MSESYYWNKANFEGLASLSSSLRSDSRLEYLANYCDLREKGLRRKAFESLNLFMEQTRSWDIQVQRELALRILDAHWNTQQAHQFISEPLRLGFLERVLEEWRTTERSNWLPLRYLGLLRMDACLLKEALLINPKDDFVRITIVRILVNSIEYATHHLVEGKFIGDESEAFTDLNEASTILEGMTSASAESVKVALQSLHLLLTDWCEYKPCPKGTFPDWCRERGHNHQWWSIVYYNS
jgi:hypothetical protein